MTGIGAKNFFLYGGIKREDFDSIRPKLWQRNLDSLRITASLAAGIGLIFLIINTLTHSAVRIPYVVLLCGGLLTLGLLPLVRRKGS